MAARYTVRVTKDYLVFCSGHFISYGGGECECLHGHNYRAACELTGDLDQNHYVFDFIALKNILKKLTDELDHKMLVPTRSTLIRTEQEGKQIVLRFRDRMWSFPREDCVLLPLENTTAELLAKHLTERLFQEVRSQHGFSPASVRMEVEESFGQAAIYEWSPG